MLYAQVTPISPTRWGKHVLPTGQAWPCEPLAFHVRPYGARLKKLLDSVSLSFLTEKWEY